VSRKQQKPPSSKRGSVGPTATAAGDPKLAEASKALAVAADALNREDFGRAKGIVTEVLRHLPQHPDALHLAGYIKLAEGQHEEGVKLIKQAIRKAPKIPMYHYNLGGAYFMQKDYLKAREAFQAAVRLDPESRDAVDNLAITLRQLKRLREAEVLFERAVEMSTEDPKAWLNLAKVRMELRKPNLVDEAVARAAGLAGEADAAFWHEVGKIYYGMSRHAEAEKYFRRALQLAPEDQYILFALGKVLAERDRYEEANGLLEEARAAGYPDVNVDLALADLHITSGEVARGRADLLRLVERDTEDLNILLDAAQSLSLIGDFDIQEELLERVLQLDPFNVGAQVQLAFVPKRKLETPAVSFMEKHIDDPGIDSKQRTSMGFALGDHYRNIKQYDSAFRYYKKGNQLKGFSWDRAAYRQWVNRTLEVYDRPFFETRTGWGSDSQLPILIVGMPRSGTTLSEQILSSHSDIHGAGEFGMVAGLCEGEGVKVPRVLDDADSVLAIDKESSGRMAENHLQRLRSQALHGEHRVTNKLPHNFQQVGLFGMLFPKAPVIHIRRDPRDNLLSIYFQDFGGYHPYAYDLKNLAFQYWEQERLMDHWKAVVPNPVFTLNYEELVGDLEGMIQRLADFLGITVEDAMRKFYQQERQVQTASKWQVRQKLYTTSMARWKPYEKHFKPMFDALREFAPEGRPDEYGLFSM